MAGMNDNAQWIVLMGFLVSLSLFFLAILINQSTLVGQTTAEGIIEFPKNDIRNAREAILNIAGEGDDPDLKEDIRNISLARNNAVLTYDIIGVPSERVRIYFNNGITVYRETVYV